MKETGFLLGKIILAVSILITIESNGQGVESKDLIFDWDPNPTSFLRTNHQKFFTKEEYRQIVFTNTLAFDVMVDTRRREIISIEYSNIARELNKLNGSTANEDLMKKLGNIMMGKIGINRISVIGGKPLPETPCKLMIVISFNKQDEKGVK